MHWIWIGLLIIGASLTCEAKTKPEKDYPLTVSIRTIQSQFSVPSNAAQTHCTSTQGTNNIDCTTTKVSDTPYIRYVQEVTFEDKHVAQFTCHTGAGKRFLKYYGQGVRENMTGMPLVDGCQVINAAYKAVYENGDLKILYTPSKGKSKEITLRQVSQ